MNKYCFNIISVSLTPFWRGASTCYANCIHLMQTMYVTEVYVHFPISADVVAINRTFRSRAVLLP